MDVLNTIFGEGGNRLGKAMDELMTTRQVAAELKVSESSVKRWCDQGIIRNLRTAGGHRRIERSGLEQFLSSNASRDIVPRVSADSERAIAPTSIEKPAFYPSPEGNGNWQSPRVADAVEGYATISTEELINRFQAALLVGDEARCRSVIAQWNRHQLGLAKLGDLLIAGSMERIGRLWECGRAEVFEERRGCEICSRLLTELRKQIPALPATAPRAIGGALSNDHYMLASQLVEVVLRDAGWNATNFGANLPFAAIAAAVKREQPRLLWLSISSVSDAEQFVREYNHFFSQLPPDLIVTVGGRALTDQLRPQIGYTAYCDNLERLTALTRVISGS